MYNWLYPGNLKSRSGSVEQNSVKTEIDQIDKVSGVSGVGTEKSSGECTCCDCRKEKADQEQKNLKQRFEPASFDYNIERKFSNAKWFHGGKPI